MGEASIRHHTLGDEYETWDLIITKNNSNYSYWLMEAPLADSFVFARQR